MARTSQIKRLPQETQDLIAQLRGSGATLDEIREELGRRGVNLARSTLGAHVKKLDAIVERVRSSRAAANAIIERSSNAPAGSRPHAGTARRPNLLVRVLARLLRPVVEHIAATTPAAARPIDVYLRDQIDRVMSNGAFDMRMEREYGIHREPKVRA